MTLNDLERPFNRATKKCIGDALFYLRNWACYFTESKLPVTSWVRREEEASCCCCCCCCCCFHVVVVAILSFASLRRRSYWWLKFSSCRVQHTINVRLVHSINLLKITDSTETAGKIPRQNVGVWLCQGTILRPLPPLQFQHFFPTQKWW